EDVLKMFFRPGGGAIEKLAARPPAETHLSVQLEIMPSEAVKKALESHRYKFGRYTLERSASIGKFVPTSHDVILPSLSLKGPDQREVPNPEGFIDEFFLPSSMSAF